MEALTRYSKAMAAGSFVLLWVLGAPSTAQATALIPDDFTGTFSGTALVDAPAAGETVSFGFTAIDTSSGGSAAHFVPGSNVTLAAGNGFPQFDTFNFSGDFIGGHLGDTWEVFVEQSTIQSSSGNNAVSGFFGGNFTFTDTGTGSVVVANAGNFSFTVGDPITVNGNVNTSGTLSPFAVGAPEIDPASTFSPLALVVSMLALASDRRRRTAS